MSESVKDQAPVDASGDQQAVPDVNALMLQLKKLEQEKAKLISENVEKKQRERATAEQAAKLAAEQGDYKLALEQERSRREELEKLAPLAERWKQFEESESARIEAEKAALTPAQQRALDAVVGVDAKRAVLAAFSDGSVKAKSQAPSHGGGPPAPGLQASFADAFGDPAKMADAKARDPDGFKKYVLEHGGFSKKASFAR